MRGKEAAQSERRREVVDLTRQVDGYQHAIRRLTAERDQLQGELATARQQYAVDTRMLRAERDEGTSPTIRALEQKLREINNHRDLSRDVLLDREVIIYNACRYISMKEGLTPSRALASVITWVVEQPFRLPKTNQGIRDYCLYKLLVRVDGWVAKTLLRARRWHDVGNLDAFNLDEVQARLEDFPIHPNYDPRWYRNIQVERVEVIWDDEAEE